jgi:translation initiation factor 1 (eIF-1/SUI1)
MSYGLNYDPTKELDEKFDDIVHLYKLNTNGRKCITIMKGMAFSQEKEKDFLKQAKTNLSTNGFKKVIPEYGSDHVYCFNGDKREELKDLLVKNFNRPTAAFVFHG